MTRIFVPRDVIWAMMDGTYIPDVERPPKRRRVAKGPPAARMVTREAPHEFANAAGNLQDGSDGG